MIGKTIAFSVPGPEGAGPQILVNGFGACMISGVPHHLEDSFFRLMAERLSRDLRLTVGCRINSFGGFPAHRAVGHVHKALADHPHFVVVQLGSTDLTVSLNRHIRAMLTGKNPPLPTSKPTDKKGSLPSGEVPFRRSVLRSGVELLKYAACRLLKVAPYHGNQVEYLASMARAVEAIQSAGAVPVLLAPFPHGDLVSDYWARRFASGLRELADRKGALFVDTHEGLAAIRHSELLLSDRLHLSKLGHARVSELVAGVIKEYLERYPLLPRESSPLAPELVPATVETHA